MVSRMIINVQSELLCNQGCWYSSIPTQLDQKMPHQGAQPQCHQLRSQKHYRGAGAAAAG